MNQGREKFREVCVDRDGGGCIAPTCPNEVTVDPDGPGEVHHIIERKLWESGGYIPENGASVCNKHHQMAEENEIPPQAFWRWIGVDYPPTPKEIKTDDCNKWGESFSTPPHQDLREYIKYPSTRHMMPLYWESSRGTAEERTGRDDTGMTSVESFLDIPIVVTIKLDGSNTMLVSDEEEPVRARNGRDAEHYSFDHLKKEYWDRNVYENLPDHLQVFGENVYAKHSIHYGCDGCCDERNRGPPLNDIFMVYGVYDTRFNLWLSWEETKAVAEAIGFPTVPVVSNWRESEIDNEAVWRKMITDMAEEIVDEGHEGIIVRSQFPFHYGQFDRKVGKYVRPNHVQTDEHWSEGSVEWNKISG